MAADEPAGRVWTGLSEAQHDGRACVICSRFVTGSPSHVVIVVGTNPAGWPVWACTRPCAAKADTGPGTGPAR